MFSPQILVVLYNVSTVVQETSLFYQTHELVGVLLLLGNYIIIKSITIGYNNTNLFIRTRLCVCVLESTCGELHT